jgi:hypothetical protein
MKNQLFSLGENYLRTLDRIVYMLENSAELSPLSVLPPGGEKVGAWNDNLGGENETS